MQALVWDGPWEMRLREVQEPVAGANEVIVHVQAVGICGSDVHGFTGATGRRISGIIMGHEFAGKIVEVGSGVRDFANGERVAVHPIVTCGQCAQCRAGKRNLCERRRLLGVHEHGAYAKYVRVPVTQLYRLDETLSWQQGAFAEPLAVALHAVNATPFDLMGTVVIVGAGPIGLLTLLVARLRGAGKIIVTDRVAARLRRAQEFGADVVVNVAKQDPLQVVQDVTRGAGADTAIEAVGVSATVQQALALTRIGGHITWIGLSAQEITLNMQTVVGRELTIRGVFGYDQEFAHALGLLQSAKLDVTPLIDYVAPLSEGSTLFDDLAKGNRDAVKVILQP